MRRDGRVGRRRSPAKRVYWETGIQGSNPCLSATILSDTSLISARTVQLFTLAVLLVPALCVSQERPADSLIDLKPRKSHRTVKEKTIIVPPEVTKRWRGIKLVVVDKVRGTENIYVVPVGTTYVIPSSKLAITVEAFLPSFVIEGSNITTSSNELKNPAAKVSIAENGASVFQGWLFSKYPNTHALSHPKFGFSLIGVVSR